MYHSPFIINPRRACAARVGLCVCLSITQHLTFHVTIHATQDTNLISSEWKSKILSDFLWKCFIAKLECFLLVWVHDKSAIFYSAENAHAYEFGPRCQRPFCSWVFCELAYWPLAVSMPPTKVCPLCKDAVPVRRKTRERMWSCLSIQTKSRV